MYLGIVWKKDIVVVDNFLGGVTPPLDILASVGMGRHGLAGRVVERFPKKELAPLVVYVKMPLCQASFPVIRPLR